MGGVFYPQARAILTIVFDGFGEDAQDSEPFVIPAMPRSLTVHRNSYNQADSWEATFDANDLPIDPQLVRGGQVELYAFDAEAVASGQRILNRQSTETDGGAGESLEVDQRMASRDRFTEGNRPLIVGIVDDLRMEMSESGKTITFSGQDYTATLIAKQWPPLPNGRGRRIPTGKRLDLWLADLLVEADPSGNLGVATENVEPTDLPIVGSGESRTNKRGIHVETETSYWDVMYGTALRYGFIIFVRGLDLIVTKPRNLHEAQTHDVKRIAWGVNIEHLQLIRHLGRERAPRIIVRSYDPSTRQTIEVEYPEASAALRAKRFKPSNLKRASFTDRLKPKPKAKSSKETVRREDEYQFHVVYGISDRQVLKNAAEAIYNRLGRAERKIIARTKDLRDIDGRSLLDLTTGNAVELEWSDFNVELVSDPDKSPAEKFEHLVSRGFNEQVAVAISEHYTRLLRIKRPFRVREVTYEYDVDSGVSIECELIDFVVVGGQRDVAASDRLKDKPVRTGDAAKRKVAR